MFVLSSEAPSAAAEVVAIALLDDESSLVLGPGSAALAEDLGDVDLLELFTQAGAAAAAGQVTRLVLPTPGGGTLLLYGVGVADAGADSLRSAGAGLVRAAAGQERVVSAVQAVADDAGLTAFVAGVVLGSFRYSLKADPGPSVPEVVLACAAPELAPVLERAEAIARASSEARRLATTPSNIKSPAWLKDQVLELVEPSRLKTKVWDVAALTKEGFGGILAVGRASATPPYLVQVDYQPARSRRRTPHVVLVGKGITFDTGGLSIKPGEAMTTMKRDMTGAAVVAATMSALAAVECPVRVTGLMPLAENAIGGAALRPGDVITHWGGRTTEVTNTDAEGRLVLADPMQYAVDTLKPDLLLDVATLTGGIKVALGLGLGGIFSNSDAAAAALIAAGAEAGEPLWRMPLAEEYESLLTSKVADSDNAPGRAPAITAALFLQHFTGNVPWVHLDIASAGDSTKDELEWSQGPTGFGVRLLLHWLGSPDPLAGVR